MLRSFVKYVILLITIQNVFSETAERGCLIPNTPQLQDLIFKIHPKNQTVELGSNVADYDVVHIDCKENYTVKGQQSLICRNGEWNHNFPTCAVYCDSSHLSRLSIKAICDVHGRFIECPKKIEPGTTINVNCAFGYTRKPKTAQILHCLPDGSFDKTPQRCEQNCGRIATRVTALSKWGIEIDSSLAPWHVAIYSKIDNIYHFMCSGSIVSPTVVISAASCFWDEANSIQKNSANYQVIAGRSTSNYSTDQNLFSQVVNVQQIHIPVEYEGKEGRFRANIAFLRLETPLKYSETIAPICIPTELKATASSYVQSNKEGFINGFGAQNQLERLKMITLAYHECVEKSPIYAPVADDKFCTYNTEGSLVCRGDSGAGFFMGSRDPETNEIIYQLWGVISDTPTTRNDCTQTGDQAYVAITNIFSTPSEFKRRLATARKEDEDLF